MKTLNQLNAERRQLEAESIAWERRKATMDKAAQWAVIGGVALTLASCSVLAPFAYVLVMAAIAAVGVFGLTLMVAGLMFNSGCPLTWLFAGDIAKAGVELAIAILQAACSAGGSD
ncbi:MAG TPA: hypothetical protein VFE62_26650 [Gemmataceae bacterium]|nr:hypothetical protein [Gemmataceae bacterium]